MKNQDFQKMLGKLKALPPKHLFAILGLGVVIFVALDVFLIARPQLASLIALNNKSKQLKLSINELSDNKLRLPKFRVTLDDARIQMKAFEAMVHKEDEIPAVLK
jgi:hypothetical protein